MTPIGVFDSGIGGLSIVRAIRARLPQVDIIYLADNEHFPFGEKPAADIRRWSTEGIQRLADLSCRHIILACNTASTNGLAGYQEAFPDLIIEGVAPMLEQALQVSKARRVAVFATFATLASEHFRSQLAAVPTGFRIYTQAGYEWVRFAEAGDWANTEIVEDIRYYLHKGVDTFVLGSTHFAFLADTIRKTVGDGVHILEPGALVAEELAGLLGEQPTGTGRITVWATKYGPSFEKIAKQALGPDVSLEIKPA